MNDETFDLADLRQFTGSEHWYRHGLVSSVLYTDGAQYVAEKAGAYWLLDEIALAQKYEKAVQGEEFQLCKLTVKNSAVTLSCDDCDGRAVFTKAIPFTDFLGDGVAFYFCNNVIHLPSEY